MNNQPFLPARLTPLEELLLRRSETAELALTQLLGVIGQHLPATQEIIGGIAAQHRQSRALGDELAACLYLQSMPRDQSGSPKLAYELYLAGAEATASVDHMVTAILPRVNGQAHPLGLNEAVLFKNLPAAVDLEVVGQPITWALVTERLLKADQEVLHVNTTLASMDSRPTRTVLIPFGEQPGRRVHFLVLTPHFNKWCILTVDLINEHFFLHCQALYADIDVSYFQVILDRALMRSQPAKLRGYFKDDSVSEDMATVLLTKIFAVTEGAEIVVEKEGLYNYKVGYGQHPQLGTVLLITREGYPLQVVIRAVDPTTVLVMNGSEGQQSKLADLEVVSKNLLVELLQALAMKLKPVKAKTRKQTKK